MTHVVICNDKLFPFVFWQMLENFIQPLNYTITNTCGGDSDLDKREHMVAIQL